MSGAQAFCAFGISRVAHSGSDWNTKPELFHLRKSGDVRIGMTPCPLRPPVEKT